jgi:DNA-directed RNA polymerase omega subunit
MSVVDRSRTNAFEFVVLAGARAKQLLRGCTPRTVTAVSDKLVKVAQREVREGKIEKITLESLD